MFNILHPDNLPAVRWKNGGGITREVARAADDLGLIWRISLADVDADGPFSRFDGLTRILTVIAGTGIDLVSPDGVIAARPGVPVRFSGDLAVIGRLIQGPIRDLNLIFDVARVNAEVQVLVGPQAITAGPGQTGCLVLNGLVWVDKMLLPDGAIAFGPSGQIDLDPGATAVLLTISDQPTS